MIPFIICYVIVLLLYFYTETSGKMYLRAPNKIILASMFLVYGIVMYFMHYDPLDSYHLLLMVALFFAWLGDIFLLYNFNRGGDYFLCGNICFALYEVILLLENGVSYINFIWAPITAIAMDLLFGILSYKWKRMDSGKMKKVLIMYILSVSLNGMLGIAIACLLPGVHFLLLGLGTMLFMISDYILMMYKMVFPGNKWCLRANSLTYFVGLLLVVLSMGL